MKSFSSLPAVMGLWLGASFSIWLGYRFVRRQDHTRQQRLVRRALDTIDEGGRFFAAIRSARPRQTALKQDEEVREDVRSLLNAIELNSAYFDRVNAATKKLKQTFGLSEFPALSEILQIRRDFWAASEVLLMEDIRSLGAELADEAAYEAFRKEAKTLLFGAGPAGAGAEPDPVELRLSIAREEAAAFEAGLGEIIAAQRERDRFPTLSEIFAVPRRLAQALAVSLREARYIVGDMATTARSLAAAMTSRGLKGAAEELRRARNDLPAQFAAAFARAGGAASQGGRTLKRHYEFLIEARELRARYAELLAKAPVLTDKGRQFLARLELERRAEEFRESSEGALAWTRQKLVVLIAYAIAGLQYIQAKITPLENKQLVPLPQRPQAAQEPHSAFDASPEAAQAPLRALLPPVAIEERPNRNRRGPFDARASEPPKQAHIRLRDLVAGVEAQPDAGDENPATRKRERKEPSKRKPRFAHGEGVMKTSFKDLLANSEQEEDGEEVAAASSAKERTSVIGRASLLDRLSAIHPTEEPPPAGADRGAPHAQARAKGEEERKPRRFRVFRAR